VVDEEVTATVFVQFDQAKVMRAFQHQKLLLVDSQLLHLQINFFRYFLEEWVIHLIIRMSFVSFRLLDFHQFIPNFHDPLHF
jgi:hypothetical protein